MSDIHPAGSSQTDQSTPTHAARANSGGSLRDALDDYNEMKELDAATDADGKVREQPNLVSRYYDVVTQFYEYAWGQSFHFSPRLEGESLAVPQKRQEEGVVEIPQLKDKEQLPDVLQVAAPRLKRRAYFPNRDEFDPRDHHTSGGPIRMFAKTPMITADGNCHVIGDAAGLLQCDAYNGITNAILSGRLCADAIARGASEPRLRKKLNPYLLQDVLHDMISGPLKFLRRF